jgi:5-methyltetrahydrofolate--homocysteine methyltransferase
MSEIIEKIKKNVIEGRVDSEDEGFEGDMEGQPGVIELVQEALEQQILPSQILSQALHPGMEEVGQRYETGEYLIPDMLASAECVSEAIDILESKLQAEDMQSRGKFVIATVEGDLHDIGKNIVSTLLKGTGFEVIDLGTAVKAEKIVSTVKDAAAPYVGLSALLTTTMGHMEEVIQGLQQSGIRDHVKVFIGGAPVSKEFAAQIGADYYCEDAFDAIGKLDTLTNN